MDALAIQQGHDQKYETRSFHRSSMMTEPQDGLTRRSALSLMSAAGAACLGAAAQPAVAGLADPPPSLPKYIFGYGSLIQLESRTRTVPQALAAWPVIVKGITRGWYYQADDAS